MFPKATKKANKFTIILKKRNISVDLPSATSGKLKSKHPTAEENGAAGSIKKNIILAEKMQSDDCKLPLKDKSQHTTGQLSADVRSSFPEANSKTIKR